VAYISGPQLPALLFVSNGPAKPDVIWGLENHEHGHATSSYKYTSDLIDSASWAHIKQQRLSVKGSKPYEEMERAPLWACSWHIGRSLGNNIAHHELQNICLPIYIQTQSPLTSVQFSKDDKTDLIYKITEK